MIRPGIQPFTMNFESVSPEIQLVVYCAAVFGTSLAGGWLPALLHLNHARVQIAVSLVSGLMLGLALLHMLPHGAGELGSMTKASAWMLAGFLAMFFLQRFLPFHHHDVEDEDADADDHGHAHEPHCCGAHAVVPTSSPLGWLAVALGLSVHSVFDGLALAAAVASAERGLGMGLGLGTALAVILHKPLCAMAITTLVRVGDKSLRWLHWVNVLFALVTPVGAALFFLGAGHLAQEHPAWLGAALAFSAGTFLCIACADLLPELQFHSHDRLKLSVALLVGLGLAILIGWAGHAGQDSHPDHGHDHAHAAGGFGKSDLHEPGGR
jgi:zinc and cadmium transporter